MCKKIFNFVLRKINILFIKEIIFKTNISRIFLSIPYSSFNVGLTSALSNTAVTHRNIISD